jgi:hypothetical protein
MSGLGEVEGEQAAVPFEMSAGFQQEQGKAEHQHDVVDLERVYRQGPKGAGGKKPARKLSVKRFRARTFPGNQAEKRLVAVATRG